MIAKVKKRYSAPELTAVVIDREIALVMATEPPPNPDKAAAIDTKSTSGQDRTSPFGAQAPDYSNMRK